jgi:hypothetical protein
MSRIKHGNFGKGCVLAFSATLCKGFRWVGQLRGWVQVRHAWWMGHKCGGMPVVATAGK